MADRCVGLKVTAWLAAPIAGEVPMLDAILQWQVAHREGKGMHIRRDQPAPSFEDVHIPVLLKRIGGVAVPCCSSPVFVARSDAHEHFTKQLAVEHSHLLKEKARLMVATGNQVYKSYRLPLRLRLCDRVVWFAVAGRRDVLKLVRSITAIGKRRSVGYGQVNRWEAEAVDYDWSWFAPSERGPVLMRPLPQCTELPTDLVGSRVDFGAVQPPYWHPDRYMERVVPC